MSDFVYQPMYTYLGNKRKLIDRIENVVLTVKERLGERPLKILDGFTGSTVVARMLAKHASHLHTNDIEPHSFMAAECFLKRPSTDQQSRIEHHIHTMNDLECTYEGVITKHYAPKDTSNVQPGERCFFTHENAMRIDTWREYIETNVPPSIRPWCLVPILIEMSIHANSLGHFKAFLKNKEGIGSFEACGQRVLRPLKLRVPVWNPHECFVTCHNESTNDLVDRFVSTGEKFDLVYYDPPYNAHEYSAFYFLLNVVIDNIAPTNVNEVTGLPKIRFKSDYNYKAKAIQAMKHLIHQTLKFSKYVLISYNNEGIIPMDEWTNILEAYKVERFDTGYKRYAANGTDHPEVTEILWLIEKKTE